MAGSVIPRSASASSTPPALLPAEFRDLVDRALKEDLGAGDVTTRLTVPEGARARGLLVSKQDLVVAGLPVAVEVFRVLDPSIRWETTVDEGAEVCAGTQLAEVTGAAATLLAGERVALNFVQHLSGIATQTRRLRAKLAGLKAELLDTRKTLPGLRALEKYAVRAGGGSNHRLRLDDGILIKNNHLRLAGGIRQAVERARTNRPQGMKIEVEMTSLAELDEAIDAGADCVLLDNMTPTQVRECVVRASGRVGLEVSGGISLSNIREYAETGVDYISVGALTHSAPAADVHFLIESL